MLKPFSEKSKTVKIGEIYQHYKGQKYKVLSIARHSETLEEVVVYQALYGEYDVWVRPLEMFIEHLESKPRFALVSP